ncbi:MAG: manganese transport protein [Actinomycetota bacterium]|nr:manganese transport protein [Actinomycetota bacterium]
MAKGEIADRAPASTASDARVASAAEDALIGKTTGTRRFLPFLGPAFIAAVAYMDPGNFATNIQGGSQFGYLLVWVVVAANLMAMLIQILSAKLGIATGRNLPELIRDSFSRPVVVVLWLLAEVVAMATDLAEFLGAALGFNLLFGLPLFPAGILTGIVTFLILGLQQRGFRPLEAVITALVGVIALCYLIELILGKPDFAAAGHSFLPPQFRGSESVLLATGILGATVMPHVIYLHSALTQNRIVVRDEMRLKRLMRFQVVDVLIAMGLAGLINVAMLMMAAAVFHRSGAVNVASIQDAHRTLKPLVGNASSVVFAVSLLASGLSSSTVGTMAGQVIMQGFLNWHIPIWVRRLATMLPALIVIGVGLNPTRTLVISQVVLSFGIPFALIPLVRFTSKRELMGPLKNVTLTTVVATFLALLITGLNLFLIYGFVAG